MVVYMGFGGLKSASSAEQCPLASGRGNLRDGFGKPLVCHGYRFTHFPKSVLHYFADTRKMWKARCCFVFAEPSPETDSGP